MPGTPPPQARAGRCHPSSAATLLVRWVTVTGEQRRRSSRRYSASCALKYSSGRVSLCLLLPGEVDSALGQVGARPHGHVEGLVRLALGGELKIREPSGSEPEFRHQFAPVSPPRLVLELEGIRAQTVAELWFYPDGSQNLRTLHQVQARGGLRRGRADALLPDRARSQPLRTGDKDSRGRSSTSARDSGWSGGSTAWGVAVTVAHRTSDVTALDG